MDLLGSFFSCFSALVVFCLSKARLTTYSKPRFATVQSKATETGVSESLCCCSLVVWNLLSALERSVCSCYLSPTSNKGFPATLELACTQAGISIKRSGLVSCHKLAEPRQKMIMNVEKQRSAEQWAELIETHAEETWRFRCKKVSGPWYKYTPTGSIFDGWWPSCCLPPEDYLYEDVVFRPAEWKNGGAKWVEFQEWEAR